MTATKTTVTRADFTVLATQAAEWRRAGAAVRAARVGVATEVAATQEFWTGAAADAAREDVRRLDAEAAKVVDAFAFAATAADSGAGILANIATRARRDIGDAEAAGHTVTEDGSVRAAYAASALGPDATLGDVIAVQVALNAAARDFEQRIRTAFAELDAVDRSTADAIDAAFDTAPSVDSILSIVPATAVVGTQPATAEHGTADGQTIADGKLSDDERTRIATHLASTRLTREQLDALGRGEHVELPLSTMHYLRNLYAEAGRDGLLEVSDTLAEKSAAGDERWPTFRQDLANGLLTISNEKVRSREFPDMTGSSLFLAPEIDELVGTRPGFDNELFGDNGAPDGNTRELPDDYRGFPSDRTSDWFQDVNRFASFLSASDPRYQPGTELAIDLDRQAAHQVWLLDNKDLGVGADPQQSWHRLVESNGEQLLAIGTRNQDASTALLTGTGPGLDAESYDRTNIFRPLFAHAWNDDGAGVAKIYDWIASDAHISDEDSSQVDRAENAGRAAYGLTQVVTSDAVYPDMLNLPGRDGDSLGNVNPIATQTLAHAISPYIADLGGAPDRILDVRGFGDLDNNETGRRLFAVIDTNRDAATILNGNAYATIAQLEARFAQSSLDHPDAPDTRLGVAAGRIQGFIQAGIDIEVADRQAAEDAKFDMRQRAFDFAASTADVALSFVPGSDFAAPVIEPFTSRLEDTIVGERPAVSGDDTAEEGRDDAIQTYSIVKSLDAQNNLDPYPPLDAFRGPDGKFVPYEVAIGVDDPAVDERTQRDLVYQVTTNYLRNHGFPTGEFLKCVSDGFEFGLTHE